MSAGISQSQSGKSGGDAMGCAGAGAMAGAGGGLGVSGGGWGGGGAGIGGGGDAGAGAGAIGAEGGNVSDNTSIGSINING